MGIRRRGIRDASITYLARSFLDYRVPVYRALDELVNGRLHVIYSTLWTLERVQAKLKSVLGSRAVGLSGERSIGSHRPSQGMANSSLCITYQPGLMSAIARTKPDILVSDELFKWTLAGIAYRLRHRVPLVVCYERTFHTERNAQWYRVAYRRLALKLVDSVCCDGRLCAEYVRWLGMPSSRITTGHMAADIDGLWERVDAVNDDDREALRRRIDTNGLIFLYVGQLIVRKGVAELLAGWARLERAAPDSGSLVIIGDGTARDDLRRVADGLGVRNVRFVGAVDYDRIAPYYAAADVFVMPTLEDNWSLVVPEAMACGLPILCSKYNGCWPELVHTGGNGRVFDPLDSADVFRALEWCLANRDRLPQMGRNSRVIVGDHSPQRAAEAILRACRLSLRGRAR
ncbi:MAG TPA: glycosyltransferase family 4 protein [Planctomycetota bacterium]|nr:glycosyltransferase family 4 protein [Planctomycetota bacterium]